MPLTLTECLTRGLKFVCVCVYRYVEMEMYFNLFLLLKGFKFDFNKCLISFTCMSVCRHIMCVSFGCSWCVDVQKDIRSACGFPHQLLFNVKLCWVELWDVLKGIKTFKCVLTLTRCMSSHALILAHTFHLCSCWLCSDPTEVKWTCSSPRPHGASQ